MRGEHREVPIKQGSGIKKSGKFFWPGAKSRKNGFASAWPTRDRTARNWAGRQLRLSTLIKSGDYIAPASANLRSLAGCWRRVKSNRGEKSSTLSVKDNVAGHSPAHLAANPGVGRHDSGPTTHHLADRHGMGGLPSPRVRNRPPSLQRARPRRRHERAQGGR